MEKAVSLELIHYLCKNIKIDFGLSYTFSEEYMENYLIRNKIVIIESLPEGDLKTGLNLYETLRQEWIDDYFFDVEYFTINNKHQLSVLLYDISRKTVDAQNDFEYILHFECHGNQTGLLLSSSEEVVWGELFSMTRPININTNNTLILVLSMCNGDKIITDIEPKERAPFFIVIGAIGVITAGVLEETFIKFYKALQGMDESEKLEQYKKNIHDILSDKFVLFTQEIIFDAYYDERLFPDAIDKLIEKEMFNLCKSNPNDILLITKENYKKYRSKQLEKFRNKYRKFFCFCD